MKTRQETVAAVRARIRLRQLMGHVCIETTVGYRHPAVESATNPLDDLLGG